MPFALRLRDPRSAVAELRLHYRRDSSAPFSSLALRLDDDGRWRGDIPGEWTASDSPYELQYYLTTHDTEGRDLLGLRTQGAPGVLAIAAGQIEAPTPFYRTWWFWSAAAAVVAAAGAATWLIIDDASRLPAADGRIDL